MKYSFVVVFSLALFVLILDYANGFLRVTQTDTHKCVCDKQKCADSDAKKTIKSMQIASASSIMLPCGSNKGSHCLCINESKMNENESSTGASPAGASPGFTSRMMELKPDFLKCFKDPNMCKDATVMNALSFIFYMLFK